MSAFLGWLFGTTASREPWRKTDITWGKKEYRESLKQYALKAKPQSEMKIKWYNILLFAPVGAGKSSVVNNIQSAFKGRISREVKTGTAEESMTLQYHTHKVIDVSKGSKQTLGFRICDTPGLHGDFSYDQDTFKKIINGNTPEGHQFDKSQAPDGGFKTDNTDTKIHCVCFVFNASTFEILNPEDMKAFIRYQKILNQTDVAYVVILTHIDIVCSEIKYEDVKLVYRSTKVQEIVKKASTKFGIPINQIFPIKNYECEIESVLNIDILTLYNLKSMLDMCEDGMSARLNRLSI